LHDVRRINVAPVLREDRSDAVGQQRIFQVTARRFSEQAIKKHLFVTTSRLFLCNKKGDCYEANAHHQITCRDVDFENSD
jgi:hypothetical protein